MEEQPVDTGGTPPRAPLPAPRVPEQKQGMSAKKKVVLGMSIALVVLLLVAGLGGGLYAWRFLKAAEALTIEDVDISRVPDGDYSGSCNIFHVKAAVAVDVADGRIVSIELLDSGKITGERQQEIRDILNEVISRQSLDVDVTSGASVTKKVSLKAVEEALSGGG